MMKIQLPFTKKNYNGKLEDGKIIDYNEMIFDNTDYCFAIRKEEIQALIHEKVLKVKTSIDKYHEKRGNLDEAVDLINSKIIEQYNDGKIFYTNDWISFYLKYIKINGEDVFIVFDYKINNDNDEFENIKDKIKHRMGVLDKGSEVQIDINSVLDFIYSKLELLYLVKLSIDNSFKIIPQDDEVRIRKKINITNFSDKQNLRMIKGLLLKMEDQNFIKKVSKKNNEFRIIWHDGFEFTIMLLEGEGLELLANFENIHKIVKFQLFLINEVIKKLNLVENLDSGDQEEIMLSDLTKIDGDEEVLSLLDFTSIDSEFGDDEEVLLTDISKEKTKLSLSKLFKVDIGKLLGIRQPEDDNDVYEMDTMDDVVNNNPLIEDFLNGKINYKKIDEVCNEIEDDNIKEIIKDSLIFVYRKIYTCIILAGSSNGLFGSKKLKELLNQFKLVLEGNQRYVFCFYFKYLLKSNKSKNDERYKRLLKLREKFESEYDVSMMGIDRIHHLSSNRQNENAYLDDIGFVGDDEIYFSGKRGNDTIGFGQDVIHLDSYDDNDDNDSNVLLRYNSNEEKKVSMKRNGFNFEINIEDLYGNSKSIFKSYKFDTDVSLKSIELTYTDKYVLLNIENRLYVHNPSNGSEYYFYLSVDNQKRDIGNQSDYFIAYNGEFTIYNLNKQYIGQINTKILENNTSLILFWENNNELSVLYHKQNKVYLSVLNMEEKILKSKKVQDGNKKKNEVDVIVLEDELVEEDVDMEILSDDFDLIDDDNDNESISHIDKENSKKQINRDTESYSISFDKKQFDISKIGDLNLVDVMKNGEIFVSNNNKVMIVQYKKIIYIIKIEKLIIKAFVVKSPYKIGELDSVDFDNKSERAVLYDGIAIYEINLDLVEFLYKNNSFEKEYGS